MKKFEDLTYGDRLRKTEGIDKGCIYVITGRLYNEKGWEAICIETTETGDSLGNAIAITESSYKFFACEPDLKRVIKNQIDKLEELASSENNEGRWVKEKKYLFAKECLENLLEKDEVISRKEELKHAFTSGITAAFHIGFKNITEEEFRNKEAEALQCFLVSKGFLLK